MRGESDDARATEPGRACMVAGGRRIRGCRRTRRPPRSAPVLAHRTRGDGAATRAGATRVAVPSRASAGDGRARTVSTRAGSHRRAPGTDGASATGRVRTAPGGVDAARSSTVGSGASGGTGALRAGRVGRHTGPRVSSHASSHAGTGDRGRTGSRTGGRGGCAGRATYPGVRLERARGTGRGTPVRHTVPACCRAPCCRAPCR